MENDKSNNKTVRELLNLSQTNVTLDPEEGYNYAVQAYNKAHDLLVMHDDPTALGEAAAKAGFRGEQAGHQTEEVTQWFSQSYLDLPDDRRGRREKIATRLLEGRSLSLRLIRQALAGIKTQDSDLSQTASEAFKGGEKILNEQHVLGSYWDRYGTMLSRHQATHEAIFGNWSFATTTAIRGLRRAIQANRENQPVKAHRAFVRKQLAGNAMAGLLALSRPLQKMPQINQKRYQLAQKLLG